VFACEPSGEQSMTIASAHYRDPKLEFAISGVGRPMVQEIPRPRIWANSPGEAGEHGAIVPFRAPPLAELGLDHRPNEPSGMKAANNFSVALIVRRNAELGLTLT
jgi:hypothetical protein